jgi:predicted nucleic acid-binding protein
MIPRAIQLLEYLDETQARVLVPTPVVAEFLVGAEERDHSTILQVLQTRFIVAPFDVLAALATARARRKNRQTGLEDAVRDEFRGARPQIPVDHMIIGIALANRAERLYTNDAKLRRFAEPHLTVREIPPLREKQMPLPED